MKADARLLSDEELHKLRTLAEGSIEGWRGLYGALMRDRAARVAREAEDVALLRECLLRINTLHPNDKQLGGCRVCGTRVRLRERLSPAGAAGDDKETE